MFYSDFTLEKVKQSGLIIIENTVLFPDVTPQEPSQLLTQWLKEYVSLAVAINTEKARSEFLINPIKTIAGCVTTGQIYRFIKLEDSVVTIDVTDYYINDVASILGIFVQPRAIAL